MYAPLPRSVHVYFTSNSPDTGKFRAYYLEADLKDKKLQFTTDTAMGRRLTPSQFYQKNKQPLVVVNGTFFSFETNQNLNLVIRNGKLLAYNRQSLPGRGKDTLTYRHPLASAIGIHKNRKADVAWTFTDSASDKALASQKVMVSFRDSMPDVNRRQLDRWANFLAKGDNAPEFDSWEVETAIGGGPVLVQDGAVMITNNQELKFAGKAINDKHPRTAMGYTRDNKLIILVIEGRNENARGATLIEAAQILKDLGCVEALNLDGGGSSCLLINGKPTIKVSDKEGQRPVPAVFLVNGEL